MQKNLTVFQFLCKLHVTRIKREIKIKLVFYESNQQNKKNVVVVGSNYSTTVKQWYNGIILKIRTKTKGKEYIQLPIRITKNEHLGSI